MRESRKQKAEGRKQKTGSTRQTKRQKARESAFCLLLSAYCLLLLFTVHCSSALQLLSEDRSLAPAYNLQRRKAKLVNHSEALLSLPQDFFARVLLEAKQNFEEGCSWRRTAGDMQ